MSRNNYAGPSGLRAYDGWNRGDAYAALEQLPERLRKRLNEASVPIPPAVVLAYYRQQVEQQGRPPDLAEQNCIDKIERTERTAADTLAAERETWNIGEEMAASMKAVHSRSVGRPRTR